MDIMLLIHLICYIIILNNFHVALTSALTVMGECICSASGKAFTDPLLVTIGIYCYEQWVREG